MPLRPPWRLRPLHDHHIRTHLWTLQNTRNDLGRALTFLPMFLSLPSTPFRRSRSRPRLAALVTSLAIAAWTRPRCDRHTSTVQRRFEMPTEPDHGSVFALGLRRNGSAGRRAWRDVFRGHNKRLRRAGTRRRRRGRRGRGGRITLARVRTPMWLLGRPVSGRRHGRFHARRRSARRTLSQSTLPVLRLLHRRLSSLFAQRRGGIWQFRSWRGGSNDRLLLGVFFFTARGGGGVLVMSVIAKDRFLVFLRRLFRFESFEKRRGRRAWGWLRGGD